MANLIKDVPYATQSLAQKLDIYLPPADIEPFPVIIWLHPGGYTRGDKDMVKPLVNPILASGYAVISANYRLAGEVCFPGPLYDIKAAVRWVRANATLHKLDAGRIGAWGISAGATFAALLGVTGGDGEFEDLSMGNSGESSHVDAVVAVEGPMEFGLLDDQLIEQGYKPMHEAAQSGESMLLGGRLSSLPEKCRIASPMTHVNVNSPPFYLQQGTADEVVPYLQSVRFAEALSAAIGMDKVELHLIENVGHFDAVHTSTENIGKALRFLDRYLKCDPRDGCDLI